MSLLDTPTDELEVWPEVDSTDGYGTPVRVAGDVPVYVAGRVQPVRAEEAVALGQSVGTFYRFIGRDFPTGAHARVSWDDRDWDVVGEPLWSRGSEATRHVSVLLKARGPVRL